MAKLTAKIKQSRTLDGLSRKRALVCVATFTDLHPNADRLGVLSGFGSGRESDESSWEVEVWQDKDGRWYTERCGFRYHGTARQSECGEIDAERKEAILAELEATDRVSPEDLAWLESIRAR